MHTTLITLPKQATAFAAEMIGAAREGFGVVAFAYSADAGTNSEAIEIWTWASLSESLVAAIVAYVTQQAESRYREAYS